MIDRKPFRVTNEQLKEWAIQTASEDYMNEYKHIRLLSEDLIDSRELIDKQEALIKEMRDAFTIIHQNSIAFVCEDMRALERIQLEKTNEYAPAQGR